MFLTLTSQRPSVPRVRPVTLWPKRTSAPAPAMAVMSWRVREPKSTSVPPVLRDAARRWPDSRPSISSGAQARICSGSSLCSMPANSGWADMAS